MDLIIDFYKGLDTLNLIIFWGIIIVIILLLIFSFILINKNKKLKRIVEKQNKIEEEIPIKKEEIIKEVIIENEKESEFNETTEDQQENLKKENDIQNTIQTEKDFVVEEFVSGYQTNESATLNNHNTLENSKQYQNITMNNIEIPNKPYQRNVLREMSLSQTSPIGINRTNTKDVKEDKKIEMIKDLEESLNDNDIEQKEETQKQITPIIDNTIKQELSNIKNDSDRNTKIKNESIIKINQNDVVKEEIKIPIKDDTSILKVKTQNNILENYQDIHNNNEERKEKKSSETYLEEVSRKLAEAEVPDEIERTNYELQQEEDAIISYKELMEKKDSIQTIDEEEAVISIEELMNRANVKEEVVENDARLYNLSEDEANDNFIKELKQFRSDL